MPLSFKCCTPLTQNTSKNFFSNANSVFVLRSFSYHLLICFCLLHMWPDKQLIYLSFYFWVLFFICVSRPVSTLSKVYAFTCCSHHHAASMFLYVGMVLLFIHKSYRMSIVNQNYWKLSRDTSVSLPVWALWHRSWNHSWYCFHEGFICTNFIFVFFVFLILKPQTSDLCWMMHSSLVKAFVFLKKFSRSPQTNL